MKPKTTNKPNAHAGLTKLACASAVGLLESQMKLLKTRNARFWQWINGGPVKITLKPGQSLAWETGGVTDEGYSWEGHHWVHEGNGVLSQVTTDGTDCDGRLSRHGNYFSSFDMLTAGHLEEDGSGIAYPTWETVEEGQRDYSAEAMGY